MVGWPDWNYGSDVVSMPPLATPNSKSPQSFTHSRSHGLDTRMVHVLPSDCEPRHIQALDRLKYRKFIHPISYVINQQMCFAT